MRIRIKGARASGPSERPPPGDRPRTAIVQPGRANPPGLPVYISRPASAEMLRQAERGGGIEVGGFLLGGWHTWRGHPYVDVTTPVPALKAQGGEAHLKFTNEVQREFHAVAARRYPGLAVVGWYHTHPGYGVFLSEHDLFIQRGFFREPHHVAVVIDPRQHSPLDRVGVFVWERGDVSEGYHPIVYVEDPAS